MESGVKCVVLDANALMMPFQFKLNLDTEVSNLLGPVEMIVPSSVMRELGHLKAKEAKAALSLAKKYRVFESTLSGDDGVVEAAEKNHAAVVTNDQELMQILKKLNIPVIRMRACQRLDFA